MMSEFIGFSDREIKTIQGDGGGSLAPRKQAEFSGPRRSHRGRESYFNHRTLPPPPGTTGLPKTAYIIQQSQQVPTTCTTTTNQTEPNETKHVPNKDKDISETDRESSSHVPVSCESNTATDTATEGNGKRVPDLCLDSQVAAASSLEILQKQQKELEDENKKKKALVEQTLQERYARSEMEVKTLQLVKEELTRLDSLLTRDVTILRGRIEDADRQYTTARKRYEMAEAEFVAAKLELHRSSESKELLSEHLCTIIQQNEVRKAEKLADLLKTLKLDNEAEHSLQSHPVSLFQKTPTPGINIWPRERLCSKERPPSQKEASSEEVKNNATTTSTSVDLHNIQEQNSETGPADSNMATLSESSTPAPNRVDTQDSTGDKDSPSSPLIDL